MASKRNRPNPRLVKIHRSYTVEEVAQLFGIHRNTVRNWIRQGLPTVDERRPTLILGSRLLLFLNSRRTRNKRRCGPSEIYCVACREPRKPAGGMAELVPAGPKTADLCGICPVCEAFIHRRISLARRDDAIGDLEVTGTQPPSRIRESADLCVNCDLEKEQESDADA